MNSRLQMMEATIRTMYEVISFPEGMEPDFERMNQVFAADARITRITPEGVDTFDLPTFQAMVTEMLDLGVYTGFHEREVARRAEIFGALAHVLSAYETKRSPEAAGFLARGVNSIQLIWTGESWRVLSLFWDEETERNPLDLERVFASEVIRG